MKTALSFMTNPPDMVPAVSAESRAESFWRRRVVRPVVTQLTQGLSPERAALTVGLGMALSTFPILGTTSFLCIVVGLRFRLNQPILQIINWLMAPVHLLMIPVFIRIGEGMTGVPPVPFSVKKLVGYFMESPMLFMAEFGWTGARAILAWAVLSPLVVWLCYVLFLPVFKKLARKNAA
ncbi:MAG TPA: DUF2062 domain-containing protein [Roseimicrobium sp.]|nr:DUF2062 domain-containing protein [Roseimicrobium sp.]